MKQRGLLTELWRTRTVRIWIFCVGALFVFALILLVIIVRPAQKSTSAIPQAVIELANFTPYFYKGTIPGTFTANKSVATYASDVLLIRLTNAKNQTITMTQQALPPDLTNTKVQGSETIEGTPGTTTITANEGRTTATLFTNDKTMVIITTSDAIDSAIVKELLRSLKPLR